ncbi:hypothetical protein CYY_007165 [Polysphondylium violaceum]|uniref:Uncharacterized protein n=1 Tax=Polysphondylium violaceum TaxID=133409 RepID=A0A8J4UR28_9MYCE|nr:hypothetical protein CYY_007165 [Polysphondylium violaceum]
MADQNDDDNNIYTIKNLKHCEEALNNFFADCANNKDLNKAKPSFEALSKCAASAQTMPQEEHQIHPAVKLLQYYLPRIFTSDLPRERTILADSLAYVAPKIFDPEDDDDDDDDN